MKRRTFIKSAALAGIGTAVAAGLGITLHSCTSPDAGRKASGKGIKLRFFPYEIRLAHTFTVASYSRTTTPDVQLELEFDGIIGYGEASMPPYLGHSVESVCNFLSKVNLEQFKDPFCIEDILSYVDSLSEGDAPRLP